MGRAKRFAALLLAWALGASTAAGKLGDPGGPSFCPGAMRACRQTAGGGGIPFDPPDALESRRQALYCFLDSAFGSEYGEGDKRLVRWEGEIRLFARGNPTWADLNTVDGFILELNARVPGLPRVTRITGPRGANMTVTFCRFDDMSRSVDGYVEGNWGFFSNWYEDWSIYRAEIAIATDVTTQLQRNHLIKEEIVGALGLGNDIHGYSDSILYQEWSETQELSELDWMMLGYLYSPWVDPGMTAPEAYAALHPSLWE